MAARIKLSFREKISDLLVTHFSTARYRIHLNLIIVVEIFQDICLPKSLVINDTNCLHFSVPMIIGLGWIKRSIRQELCMLQRKFPREAVKVHFEVDFWFQAKLTIIFVGL